MARSHVPPLGLGLARQSLRASRASRNVPASCVQGLYIGFSAFSLTDLTTTTKLLQCDSIGHFTHTNQFGSKPWYRHVCAIGAVLNMLMMMTANLVGFVIGTDGVRFFVDELLGTSAGPSLGLASSMSSCCVNSLLLGLRFLLGAFVCMFIGAQLMFEYRHVDRFGVCILTDIYLLDPFREEEKRHGVYRRC